MKKITLMIAALISAVTLVATINLGNKNKVVMTDTSLLLEEFNGLTQGNLQATGNCSAQATSTMIPTSTSVTAAYQAGGTLKLGSSSNAGSITFNAIDASAYDSIRIEFDAKSWANKVGQFNVTYGSHTEVLPLTQSGTMPFYLQDFDHCVITFAAESAPTAITLATGRPTVLGDYRAYLDNVEVFGISAGGSVVTVADPVFTPAPGAYDDSVVVTISCATPDAEIMYLVAEEGASDDDLDGGMGVPSPMPYTGPITIRSTSTITALAFIEDTVNMDLFISQEVTGTYTITSTTPDVITVDDPVFTPAAGTYNDSVVVTITCATPDAMIVYNLTDPADTLGIPTFAPPSYGPSPVVLTVRSTTLITAQAMVMGDDDDYMSNEVSALYTIVPTTPAEPEYIITLPYTQDFAAAALGTLVSTSSSGDVVNDSVLNLLVGIDSVAKCYQAGGMVRLGSGSGSGMVMTNTIDAGTAAQIEVGFDAIAWPNKNVRVALAYGAQNDTVALNVNTNTWPLDATTAQHYTAVFNAEANATLTITGINGLTNGDRRMFLDNLTIAEYVEDTTQIVVDAPVFTPAAGTYMDSVVVTLAADSTAAIYYTLDGTDPTDSSTLYTGAFTLTATTTVKAVAKIDGVYSTVATATYTFPEAVADIAAFIAAGQGTHVISGDVVAVYQQGQNLYIQDASASILVYGNTGKTYANGDVISGMVGTYGTYNGAAQIVPVLMPEGVAGTPVQPVDMNLEDITTADVHRFVRISGVTFTAEATYNTSSRTNGTVTDGAVNVVVRNNFLCIDGTFGGDGDMNAYDIVCFVAVYQNNVQLYPISIDAQTGVKNEIELANVYVNNGVIFVPTTAGERVTVFSATGAVLYDEVANDNLTVIANMPDNQMMIVKVGNRAAKIVK